MGRGNHHEQRRYLHPYHALPDRCVFHSRLAGGSDAGVQLRHGHLRRHPGGVPHTERRKVERHVKPPSGMMLRGVRDGYAFREQSESRTTVTADCYAHVAPGSPPYVGVGFYEVGTPATALQQVTNSAGMAAANRARGNAHRRVRAVVRPDPHRDFGRGQFDPARLRRSDCCGRR